jgi:hypothetical protein
MGYLTLFLCAKFAIAIPFLAPRSYTMDNQAYAIEETESRSLLTHHVNNAQNPKIASHDTSSTASQSSPSSQKPQEVPLRNQAAGPPTYLLIFVLVPISVAAWVCTSRYVDFRHHGIDIFTGAIIGVVTSWFAFRWYHLPIRRGAGWAWGARSRDRAFGIGVGVGGYVGPEGWASEKHSRKEDVEAGRERNDESAEILSGGFEGPGEEASRSA